MEGEQDEPSETGDANAKAGLRLRVVQGPLVRDELGDQAPPVRVRREFKGLTVADLQREDISTRLPGQVRSALQHIEHGDLAAAEHAVPGQFARVLVGPGHRRRQRWPWFAVAAVGAVALGYAIVSCLPD